jgi:hypothetical protein
VPKSNHLQENTMLKRSPIAVASGLVLSLWASLALAQNGPVKPPQAQAWIDVATYSGMGMPGMGGMGNGGSPMAALGSLFGGGGGKNSFGNTQSGSAGRWVDVTLYTRNNPSLNEAQQTVPSGFLSPALKLQSPKETKGSTAPTDDDSVVEPQYEKPRGKLLMYWGCGAKIRPGQPKVLDMASASAADMAKFFISRRATQRGTHSAVGRPLWPSPADARMVPDNASLVGEHAYSGNGVPEAFRFNIPAAQDLMPPLKVQQSEQGGATDLSWAALPTARAYFAAGMGAAKPEEMVVWTSSEVPEAGFGLIDYQTNPAVDRWPKEGVLLSPHTTHCTVPQGVFPEKAAMLRMIAYGSELNLAHPPRPADPKAAWEPVWAVKLRVKSVASVMLGMPAMDMPTGRDGSEPAEAPAEKKVKPMDLLKGIQGR